MKKSCTSFFFLVTTILIPSLSSAGAVITYHGRLLDHQDRPLEATNVTFRIRIYSPNPAKCLLYEESRNINMSDSQGVFAIPIGDGDGARTGDDPGLTIEKIFANNGSVIPNLLCNSTDSYTSQTLDQRQMVVSYDDHSGYGWDTLPPMTLGYVPFAVNAHDAQLVGGVAAKSLLRVVDPNPSNPAFNAAPLTPNGFTELLALINGTSSQYEKVGKLAGTTLPVLGDGQVLGWSGGSWTAITPMSSYTETDPTVRSFAKSNLPSCGANSFLQNDGSGNLTCVPVSGLTGGTVTSLSAGTGLKTDQSGNAAITATGTLSVDVGTGPNKIVQLDASGKLPALDGSQLSDVTASALSSTASINTSGNITTSGTLSAAQVTATGDIVSSNGNIQTNKSLTAREGLYLYDAKTPTPGSVGLKAPSDVPVNYVLTLPVAQGGSGQVLGMSATTGQLTWINPSSGSVTNVTATSPLVSSGGATPAISLQKADGTHDGYLSQADWSTFNSKQAAGNYVTALTGDVTSGAFTSGSLATTISNNAVTSSKIADGAVNSVSKIVPSPTSSGTNRLLATDPTTGTTVKDFYCSALAPFLKWTGDSTGFGCQTLSSSDITGFSTAVDARITAQKGQANGLATLDASSKVPAAQIPNIDWSTVTSKPTTLSGYGITDSLVTNGGGVNKISSGLDTSKPASPATGDLFVATDAKKIYRYSGSAWDLISSAAGTGGTVTSVAIASGNGFAGTVTNANSDPSISISTTVNGLVKGNGTGLSAATQGTDYSVGTSALATGLLKSTTGTGALSIAASADITTALGYTPVNKAGDSMTNNLTFPANKGNVYTAGSGAGTVTLQGPTAAIGTNYILRLPTSAPGTSGQALVSDTSGNLSWSSLSSGSVTSVSATSPLSSTGGTTPTLSLAGLSGLGTANQILGMNAAGGAYEYKSITGAANQISVTHAANSITLSTPQNIHSGASPTFTGLTLSGMTTAGLVKNDASGVLSGGNTLNIATETSGTLGVARGGTGATSFGTYGVVVTGGSTTSALSAVNSAINGTILQNTVSGPAFSTAAYPSTTTANRILYSSANNIVGQIPSVLNGVLVTDGSGVPGFSSTAADLFSQYAMLNGRPSGQTLSGSTSANGILTLQGTSHSTVGNIVMNPSGGNVGIGTSSPTTKLDVNGTVKATAFEGNGAGLTGVVAAPAGSNTQIQFNNAGTLGASTYLSWVNAGRGKLGVGIAASSYPLHVDGQVSGGTTSAYTVGRFSTGNSALDIGLMGVGGGAWLQSRDGTTSSTSYNLLLNPEGGNVGIGTTSPTTKLDVSGTVKATAFEGNGAGLTGVVAAPAGSSGNIQFNNAGVTAASGVLTYEAMNGYLGVGTPSPSRTIDVARSVGNTYTPATVSRATPVSSPTIPSIRIAMTNSGDNYGAYLEMQTKNSANLVQNAYMATIAGSGASNYSPALVFGHQNGATSYTERMRIDTTGNVGIGTTIPSAKLEVAGGLRVADGTMAAPSISFAGKPDTGFYLSSGEEVGIAAGGSLLTSFTPWNIYSYVPVYVPNGAANSVSIGSSSGGGLFFPNVNTLAVTTNSLERMRVDSSGNVGIGVTAPAYKLHVAGDINTTSCFRIGATTVSGTCTSDERLKENIQDYTQGLAELLNVRLRTYQFNGLGEMPKDGTTAVGVIAQEIEKTNPDLVKPKMVKMHPEDQELTEIKAVDYSKFTYMLINSVKELYAKHVSQSRQVASIEEDMAAKDREIAELKARLDRLEKAMNKK